MGNIENTVFSRMYIPSYHKNNIIENLSKNKKIIYYF